MRPRAWCLREVVATFADDQLVLSKADGRDPGEDQPEGRYRENLGSSRLSVWVRPKAFPLCVDCDGTLLRTDLLHEAVCLLAKQSPASLLMLPLWLLRGKSYLKQQIASRVLFNFDCLPVCEPVIELIKQARDEGRQVVLATASPRPWAEGVARRVGLFDNLIASDERTNLAGRAKTDEGSSRYGAKRFEYVIENHWNVSP